MWLIDWLRRRGPDEQTRRMHEIELKLDDIDFRVHRTLGEHSGKLNALSSRYGQVATTVTKLTVRQARYEELDRRMEQLERSLAVVSRACDLIVEPAKELVRRADLADEQIVALCRWAGRLEDWLQGPMDGMPPEAPTCVSPPKSTDAATTA